MLSLIVLSPEFPDLCISGMVFKCVNVSKDYYLWVDYSSCINQGTIGHNHPGQSFPLSLCGPNSISRANAHMVYG